MPLLQGFNHFMVLLQALSFVFAVPVCETQDLKEYLSGVCSKLEAPAAIGNVHFLAAVHL